MKLVMVAPYKSKTKTAEVGGVELYFPRGALKNFPFQENEVVKINIDPKAKSVTLTKPDQDELDAYDALMMRSPEEDLRGVAVGNPTVYFTKIKCFEV